MNRLINRLKSRLSWKIFLLVFALSMLSSVFTIACISLVIPAQFFEYTLSFEDSVSDLQTQLDYAQSVQEQEQIIQDFSANSGYSYSYKTQQGQDEVEAESFLQQEATSEWTMEEPDRENITFVVDHGGEVTEVTVYKDSALLERVFSTFLSSLIPIIVWVFLLSLALSWLYSRKISGPIIRLDEISKKMMGMDYVPENGNFAHDEIGELSRNVHQLYERLFNTITQLRIKNEQQQEFFRAASHDLKTPLTIVEGSLQLLEQDLPSDSIYLQSSLKACQRMEHMIAAMLSLSKLENEPRLRLERVRLDELIRKEIIDILPLIEHKRQTVQLDLDLPVELELDPQLFSAALRNLLSNATLYSGENEKITVSLNQTEILELIVENTGIFLQEEDLEKVFEPLYRCDPSRHTKGNGLGLAIAKKIVEAHSFLIYARNTAQGVAFTINFTKTSQSAHKKDNLLL